MTPRRVLVMVPLLALVPLGSAVAGPARLAEPQAIGQTSGTSAGCPGGSLTAVQYTTGASPGYETTGPGVVTSFSYLADGGAGEVRALLFTRITPTTFQLVGKSALQTVTTNQLNAFPTRIPVPTGALLGSQLTSSDMRCAVTASSSFDEFRSGVFDPDSSSTMTTTGSFAARWNISAVVEADADGDGYGDTTQDLCPSSPTTQTACGGSAPDTIITKTPKRKSTKRKAKLTFSSTVAGSTFTCSVDKKPTKPCKSPFKKRFNYGKHKVVVTAISPLGIADPTPVTVRFRVERPS